MAWFFIFGKILSSARCTSTVITVTVECAGMVNAWLFEMDPMLCFPFCSASGFIVNTAFFVVSDIWPERIRAVAKHYYLTKVGNRSTQGPQSQHKSEPRLLLFFSRPTELPGRTTAPLAIRRSGPSHIFLKEKFNCLHKSGEITVMPALVSTIAFTTRFLHVAWAKTKLERSVGGIVNRVAVATPLFTTVSSFFSLAAQRRGLHLSLSLTKTQGSYFSYALVYKKRSMWPTLPHQLYIDRPSQERLWLFVRVLNEGEGTRRFEMNFIC